MTAPCCRSVNSRACSLAGQAAISPRRPAEVGPSCAPGLAWALPRPVELGRLFEGLPPQGLALIVVAVDGDFGDDAGVAAIEEGEGVLSVELDLERGGEIDQRQPQHGVLGIEVIGQEIDAVFIEHFGAMQAMAGK